MDDVRQTEAEAFAAAKDGNFERAIQLWEEILEVFPRWENGFAHYNLADCYACTGRIDLAIDAYRKAIAIAPEETMFSSALQSILEAKQLGHI